MILTKLEKGLKYFLMQKRFCKGDELEILGVLINPYKNEYFPIDLPDPIEAIKFKMKQSGDKQSDLAKLSVQKVAQVKFLI